MFFWVRPLTLLLPKDRIVALLQKGEIRMVGVGREFHYRINCIKYVNYLELGMNSELTSKLTSSADEIKCFSTEKANRLS